jgi:hypothetical protein
MFRPDQTSSELFNGSAPTALGILVHLSETTGRIEARQTAIQLDVKQTKADVRKIDKRLQTVEQRKPLSLTDLYPYGYGLMILTLAASGKIDWSKASELLK